MKQSDPLKDGSSEKRTRKSAFDRALLKDRTRSAGRAKTDVSAETKEREQYSTRGKKPGKRKAQRRTMNLGLDDFELGRWQSGPSGRHSQSAKCEVGLADEFTEIPIFDSRLEVSPRQTPNLGISLQDDSEAHHNDGSLTERSQRPTARVGSSDEGTASVKDEVDHEDSVDAITHSHFRTKKDASQVIQEKDQIICKLQEKCTALVAASKETVEHLADARMQIATMMQSEAAQRQSVSAVHSTLATPRKAQTEKHGNDSPVTIPLLHEAKRFWDSLEASHLKAEVVGKINLKFLQLCRDRDLLRKDNKALRTSLQKMLLKNLVDRIDDGVHDRHAAYETDLQSEPSPLPSRGMPDEAARGHGKVRATFDEGRRNGSRSGDHALQVEECDEWPVENQRSGNRAEDGKSDTLSLRNATELWESGVLPEHLNDAVLASEAAFRRIRQDRDTALARLDAISPSVSQRRKHGPPVQTSRLCNELPPVEPSFPLETRSPVLSRVPSSVVTCTLSLTISQARDLPMSGLRLQPTTVSCGCSLLETCEVEAHHCLLVSHSLLGSEATQTSRDGSPVAMVRQQQSNAVTYESDVRWDQAMRFNSVQCRDGVLGWTARPLVGGDVTLVITLHGHGETDSTTTLIARLVLPVRVGCRADDWYLLLSPDGCPLVGESGMLSTLHLSADFTREEPPAVPVPEEELPCIPLHSREVALALTTFSSADACGVSVSMPAHLGRFQSNPEVFVEHFLRDIADAMGVARDRLQYSGMARGAATLMFNLLPDDGRSPASQTPLSLSVALLGMMSDPDSRLWHQQSTRHCERLVVHGPVPKVVEVLTPRSTVDPHDKLMDLELRLTGLESDELSVCKVDPVRAGPPNELEPVTTDALFEPTGLLLLSDQPWLSPCHRAGRVFQRRFSTELVSQHFGRAMSVGSMQSTPETENVAQTQTRDADTDERVTTATGTSARVERGDHSSLDPMTVNAVFQPMGTPQVVFSQQWSPRPAAAEPAKQEPREEKHAAGVGLSLTLCTSDDGKIEKKVWKVIRGGAADLCGRIREGDVLIAVDGREVRRCTLDSVRGSLIGEAGSSVSLQLKRTDDPEGRIMYTVALVRQPPQHKRNTVSTSLVGNARIGVMSTAGEKGANDSTQRLKAGGSTSSPQRNCSEDSAGRTTREETTASLPRPDEQPSSRMLSLSPQVLPVLGVYSNCNCNSPELVEGVIPSDDAVPFTTNNGDETSPVVRLKLFRRLSPEGDILSSPPSSPSMPRVLPTSPRRFSAIGDDSPESEGHALLLSHHRPLPAYDSPRLVDTSPRYDLSPHCSPLMIPRTSPSRLQARGMPAVAGTPQTTPVTPRHEKTSIPVSDARAASVPELPALPLPDAFGLVKQSPRPEEPARPKAAAATPFSSPQDPPASSPPRTPSIRSETASEWQWSPAALPGRDRQEERRAVPSSVVQASSGVWRVDAVVVEACGLVRLHGVGLPNLFCRATVGAAGSDRAWQEQIAQHSEHGAAKETEVVAGSMQPVWQQMFTFGGDDGGRGRAAGAASPWRRIGGQALELTVTVHDMMGATSAFRGMVSVPVLAGLSEDCWYTLQNRDGSPMYGPSGQPSRIRIQTHYWQPPPSLPPLSLPINPLAPAPATRIGPEASRSSVVVQLPTDAVHTEDVVVTASLTPRNLYDSPHLSLRQGERIVTPRLTQCVQQDRIDAKSSSSWNSLNSVTGSPRSLQDESPYWKSDLSSRNMGGYETAYGRAERSSAVYITECLL